MCIIPLKILLRQSSASSSSCTGTTCSSSPEALVPVQEGHVKAFLEGHQMMKLDFLDTL